MEAELRELLEAWGIASKHIDRMNDEDIHSIELMILMNVEMIKSIFTTMGSLLHFQKKLEELKAVRSIQVQEDIVRDNPTDRPRCQVGNVSEELCSRSNSPGGEDGTNRGSTEAACVSPTSGDSSISVETNQLPRQVLSAAPQVRKRPLDPSDVIGDLKDLLEKRSGLNGKLILSYFREKNELNEEMRDKLADIILNELLKDDYNRKISYETEVSIARKVEALFPSEEKDVWVSPLSNRRQIALGRGRLLTRYYSKRRKLLGSGCLTKEKVSDETDEPDSMEENEDMLWLMNNKQPWSSVTEHWKASSKLRMRRLMSGNQTVNEYMDSFPALKDPSGYLLFEVDFELYFKVNALTLYAEWPSLASFIESKVPPRVLEEITASETPEGRKIRTLLALPYLFKVVTVAKKKTKQWRPSRSEVGEALLFQAKVVGDIESGLDLRYRTKYEPFNLPLGPQAIAVGPDPDRIQQSYVRVDKTLYQVENPLKAVDIAFKALHALDCKYHSEAGREWLFLERAVYKVNLDKVAESAKVLPLLEEYRKFKQNT